MDVVSWTVAADNKLEAVGVMNTLDSSHPTDATLTLTVRNRAGTIVTGLNALAMPYVAGTSGDQVTYRAVVDDSIVPPIGLYDYEITATRASVTGKKYGKITVEKG